MSRYGSVTVSSPTSLITRIVQSSESDDLQSKTNAAIASLPAGYIVVGITLAGAGDGFTFTVTVEAGATADVTGGFTAPPTVACFLASEAEALLLQRLAAGPTNGPFADTQIAGSAKGTRFMGLVVKGDVANSGGGASILAIGEVTNPDPVTVVGGAGATDLGVEIDFVTWTPGDILIVEYWSGVTQNDETAVDFGYSTVPVFDVGSGFAELDSSGAIGITTLGTASADVSLVVAGSVSVACPVAPKVKLQGGSSAGDVIIQANSCILRAYRVPASLFIVGPAGVLP